MRDKRMSAGEFNSLSSFPQLVQKVRENAHSLYSVLKQAWCCSCSVSHTTLLRLENRGGQIQEDQDLGTRFDVLFIMPQKTTLEGNYLDGEFHIQQHTEENVQIRQGVEVKISDSIKAKPQPVKPLQLVDNDSASTVTSMEMSDKIQKMGKVEQKSSLKGKVIGLRNKARLAFRYAYVNFLNMCVKDLRCLRVNNIMICRILCQSLGFFLNPNGALLCIRIIYIMTRN